MTITATIFILSILTALITFIAIPFVRKLSVKVGAVDVPKSKRKIHKFNVPYAGLAVFLSFFIVVLIYDHSSIQIIGLLSGCLVLAVVGFLDDLFEISSAARILGQLVAAIIVISVGIRVDIIGNFGNGNDGLFSLGAFSIPFTLCWIVGITNAIRILDGLDGLVSGVIGIVAATLGVVDLITGRPETAVLCFILSASAFSFLPSNFSNNQKRKVFLGDVGSNFLGFAIAVVAIMGTAKTAAAFSMVIPILVLFVPIFDTLFAIVRRTLAGKSPFEADRLHLHFRIMDSGLGQRKATLIIYGITILLSIISILLAGQNGKLAIVIFVLTVSVFLTVLWKFGLIKTVTDKK